MKIIMAFLLMSLFFCGCDRRQAESQSRIVGTWIFSGDNTNDHGKITFDPDGHLLSDWHYNISHSNIYNGTWQIAGDILTMTVTNVVGSEPHEQVGSVDHFKIGRLAGSELIYSNLSDTIMQPEVFTREK